MLDTHPTQPNPLTSVVRQSPGLNPGIPQTQCWLPFVCVWGRGELGEAHVPLAFAHSPDLTCTRTEPPLGMCFSG